MPIKQKRINFDVPLEIHIALKTAAASNNMTLKAFIVRLILTELTQMGLIKIN